MSWLGKEHHHFKDHHGEARTFTWRIIIAAGLVLVLFGVLVTRFYFLQVTHHQDYVTKSDRNRIQVRSVAPNRGLIWDRHGTLLADNRPSFTLSIVKERTRDLRVTLQKVYALIEVNERERENFHKLLRQRRRPYQRVPLKYGLSEEEMALIAVNEFALEGVVVEAQLIRHYPLGDLFAHTIGYVGRINEREMADFDQEDVSRYSGTHSIGKIGLEKYYENDLLGFVGQKYVETNAHGRELREIRSKNFEAKYPEPGKDLHLFLDVPMQQAAASALQGRRGAVVAMDVQTGGILAMLSAPSFDPNLFVTGISYKNYRALNQSTDLPLFNRTIQGQYPPGSTLKPLLGLGGLEEQVINQHTALHDPGFYQLVNDERLYREWKKGGHDGLVDLKKAIIESCDIFFYDMAVKMGVDRMHAFGLHFGLGSRTGVDIPSERSGLWPSRGWMRRSRGRSWYPGNSLNMSIGQGDVLATPLQLAAMTATVANRGRHIGPRLVRRLGDTDTTLREMGHYEGQVEHWDYIHKAMKDVVHSIKGTAKSLGRGMDYTMAGKTGTAQVVSIAQGEKYDGEKLSETNRDHTLFIGFAPAEQPEVAIAVIVENGEKHSATTFPVVRSVLDAYFASEARLAAELAHD